MLSTDQHNVSTALKDKQISYYKKEAGKQAVGRLIMVWVLQLATTFKMSGEKNLNEDDAGDITELILREYWFLKLAEISVFFERAKMGKYGHVYDRLDQQTLFSWLEIYIQKREHEIARGRESKDKENELPCDLTNYAPESAKALRGIILSFDRKKASKIASADINFDNNLSDCYHQRFEILVKWFPRLLKVVDRWEKIYKVKNYTLEQFFTHPKVKKLEAIIKERSSINKMADANAKRSP